MNLSVEIQQKYKIYDNKICNKNKILVDGPRQIKIELNTIEIDKDNYNIE